MKLTRRPLLVSTLASILVSCSSVSPDVPDHSLASRRYSVDNTTERYAQHLLDITGNDRTIQQLYATFDSDGNGRLDKPEKKELRELTELYLFLDAYLDEARKRE